MWVVVVGVAVVAVAAYELFTREPRATVIAREAETKALTAAQAAARIAREQAARVACALRADDMARTQTYVADHFGAGVSVSEGLRLLPSRRPPDAWPDYVRRAACYLARLES